MGPPPLIHPPKTIPPATSPVIPLRCRASPSTGKPSRHPNTFSFPSSSSRNRSLSSSKVSYASPISKAQSAYAKPNNGKQPSPPTHDSPPSVTSSTKDKIRRALQSDKILNLTNKIVSEVTYLPEGVEAVIMDASKADLIDEVARLRKQLAAVEGDLASLRASQSHVDSTKGMEMGNPTIHPV